MTPEFFLQSAKMNQKESEYYANIESRKTEEYRAEFVCPPKYKNTHAEIFIFIYDLLTVFSIMKLIKKGYNRG